jgi:hypothetical protein
VIYGLSYPFSFGPPGSHCLRRTLNGLNYASLGAAPAQVIIHTTYNFRFTGLRVRPEEAISGHDHAGCAKSALEGIMFDECLLEGMKYSIPGKTFNGKNLFPLYILNGNLA